MDSLLAEALIVVPLASASFVLATFTVRRGILALRRRESLTDGRDPAEETHKLPESSSDSVFDFWATGFWIGLCETVLVFAFVLSDQYGPLAIVIGAKEFVRKEKAEKDASYYLLGTLTNLTITLICAALAKRLIE